MTKNVDEFIRLIWPPLTTISNLRRNLILAPANLLYLPYLPFGVGFGKCVNPEFLREGSALHDIFNRDRIVIGRYDEKSGDMLEALYREFYAEKYRP